MPIRSSARGAPSLELRARPAVADATIAHRAGERRTFRVSPRHRVLFPHLGARPRVLVPVLMGQMARPAISVGDALATSPGGSGNVLGLVEIGTGRENEIFAQEQRRRDMLRWVAGLEYPGDGHRRLSVSLRMAANLASSIRDFAAENETTSLVLEWPTVSSPRRHGLIDLSRQLLPDRGTDVVFVRSNPRAPHEAIAPRTILAAIRGGASAPRFAAVTTALADACGSGPTLTPIQTASPHPDRSRREKGTLEPIRHQPHPPATKGRGSHPRKS